MSTGRGVTPAGGVFSERVASASGPRAPCACTPGASEIAAANKAAAEMDTAVRAKPIEPSSSKPETPRCRDTRCYYDLVVAQNQKYHMGHPLLEACRLLP